MRARVKQWEMRLRAAVPAPLRRAYRLIRAVGSVEATAQLPPELLAECRFCASRHALLELLPRGGVVAELGTYRGDFARSILALNRPDALHLIDIDYSQFSTEGLEGPAVTRHVGLTHEVIATFPVGHFDWVYIDADHSYEGCLRDARAAALRIRPGGVMVFNDFAHIDPSLGRYGVHRAAARFASEAGWPMAYFCYQANGLYDAAFRRPEA